MKYRWVHNPSGGQPLYDVGILKDGTLHNPRGYPDDDVRVAVLAADERRRQRRSEAATQAAQTKAKRRELRIDKIVAAYDSNPTMGPRSNCIVCGKGLNDAQSIERGIGPECFQDILARIQKVRERAAA